MFDFCFWFGIYNEFELAKRLVSQIQYHYSDIQVICVADGLDASFLNSNTTYIQGERLHLQEFGGAWVKRMFLSFLEHSSAKAMIRVEPDTWINRKFNQLPGREVAGNILVANDKNYVHGGCAYFTREAIEKICTSNLLDNSKYITDSQFSYNRFQFPYLFGDEQPNNEVHIAEDIIYSDVVQQLNLNVEQWDGVWSTVRDKCSNPQNYAVVHPVKSLCL